MAKKCNNKLLIIEDGPNQGCDVIEHLEERKLKVFAIGDVHLSFNSPVDPRRWDNAKTSKPMDIFGELWYEHYRKIYDNWLSVVSAADLVLMPGDFSWAMKLGEARYDLGFLGLLPGTIVGVAGNHDYWWQSLSQVRAALPANMRVIQNDHLVFGSFAVCGSRGWNSPGEAHYKEEDQKIYRRELLRMENSLKGVKGVRKIIVITHFMPTNEQHEKNDLIDLFLRYGVDSVVYGHLHADAARWKLPERAWGINFHLVSADYVNFTPVEIMQG
ncbi:metallophosphoesterase [Pelotomaculum terephthalicicum]|uniref:metallophosphoesterase n=1 Tax=Pelotomaculum terephthalicicum TaxID=206393 RepID=UPI0028980D80|nr:metallophosphoesterase [Pelotomaculum terephthalicicum]